jgi:cytochrome c biogenesis protein CcdA
MIILIGFAFAAGIITIISPCILPILPIILSGSSQGGKRRPLGIVAGFVVSFAFFTLMIAFVVQATGAGPDTLRIIAAIIIGLLGLSMLIPRFQLWLEMLISRISPKHNPGEQSQGLIGGFLMGLSLGLVWSPCVGPIMASVITLAALEAVTTQALIVTLAYTMGTAVPMMAIIYGGRKAFGTVPWLKKHSRNIQRGFAVVMILLAVGFVFNIDRKFQTLVLEAFPGYGTGITAIEENEKIEGNLFRLENEEM